MKIQFIIQYFVKRDRPISLRWLYITPVYVQSHRELYVPLWFGVACRRMELENCNLWNVYLDILKSSLSKSANKLGISGDWYLQPDNDPS